MSVLTESVLKRLSIELQKTDREIANFFNLDRTTVVHARKRYGIKKATPVGRKGEIATLHKLRELGIEAIDMNRDDPLSEYDILANGKRIEVKSSNLYDDKYYFSLSEQANREMKLSDTRIRLNNGRTKKVYSKTCDYLVFVGFNEDKLDFWIIPSKALPIRLQGISLSTTSKSKYSIYYNAWHLIKEG